MAKYDFVNNEIFENKAIEQALSEFYERDPKKFLDWVAKGPPPCYWMPAWRIISGVKKSKVDGVY